ncbi:MAG: endonuclease III [Solitalea-like symbiont of Acarus siro]
MSEELSRKELYIQIINLFSSVNSSAKTELIYKTPFELLIAVILSAQCTDKRVNIVTKELFKKFPEPKDLANAHFDEIFTLIRSINYPNSKTKYLIKASCLIVDNYNSIVPSNYYDLIALPGVGRKTANVLLAELFNQDVIAVDTHVFRVSQRIGLVTNAKNVLDAEKQLTKYIPVGSRSIVHHYLILHGRYVCKARRPDCKNCVIKNICRFGEKSI